MLAILQTSCNLYIVTMTNITVSAAALFSFAVLKICLDIRMYCRSIVFLGRGRHTDETVKMQCQTLTNQAAGFPGMAVTVLLGMQESDVAGTAVQ